MTTISLDLSRKISEYVVSVLREIEKVSLKIETPYFIVGATARDFIFEFGYGIDTGRATRDVDIGILVPNWDQFTKLKELLIGTGKFIPDKKRSQRVWYDNSFPVDILPFGELSKEDDNISWPPDHTFEMSVKGFDECYKHSLNVKLSSNPNFIVRVASLAGIAILKIISWDDNPARRNKDAIDLFFIMKNYLDAGNNERLFNEALDIFEEGDFDYDLASARFLGRDIGKIISHDTKNFILEILERENNQKQNHRIVMDVVKNDLFRNLSYEQVIKYFDAMLKGLIEQTH